MFTDRFWILKALVTLSLIGWLCTASRHALSELHPDIERAASHIERLEGKTQNLWTKRVLAADATSFQIETYVGPMKVLTSTPPPVGSIVSAQVRAIAPRTFEALTLHVNAGHDWKRPLNYAISIVTVVAYLTLVRPRFRGRMQDGIFRSKY